jgi:hypothetical protein
LTQSTGISSINWLAAIDIRAQAFVDHTKRNPGVKKGIMGSKSLAKPLYATDIG